METIVFFEIEDWEEEYLRNALLGQQLIFRKDKLTEQTVSEVVDATIVSPFIYSALTKSVIEKLAKLRMIATRSTGFDHIDVAFLQKRSQNVV